MPNLLVTTTLLALTLQGTVAREADARPDPDFLETWERENAGFPPRQEPAAAPERARPTSGAERHCGCEPAATAPEAKRARETVTP